MRTYRTAGVGALTGPLMREKALVGAGSLESMRVISRRRPDARLHATSGGLSPLQPSGTFEIHDFQHPKAFRRHANHRSTL